MNIKNHPVSLKFVSSPVAIAWSTARISRIDEAIQCLLPSVDEKDVDMMQMKEDKNGQAIYIYIYIFPFSFRRPHSIAAYHFP